MMSVSYPCHPKGLQGAEKRKGVETVVDLRKKTVRRDRREVGRRP